MLQTQAPRLGLKENLGQFSLLVLVNAFVGGMVGMERSILPQIAEQDFQLTAHSAILSFIALFGISKAMTNYVAGRWADQYGRKKTLLLGWFISIPIPFLLMWANSWSLILLANILLGISQGLTWSSTVIMKIDLAGPKNRGFALGINECAGYFSVALSALGTSYIAAEYALRPQPFYLGIALILFGGLLSLFLVKETKQFAELEQKQTPASSDEPQFSSKELILHTSFKDKNLSSICQAGLFNNLNDGMAWGLFPLLFAQANQTLEAIGILTAIYPAVWGIGQLFMGGLSDKFGRKGLIIWGMWLQALGILGIALSSTFKGFATGSTCLGLGTAMVYPTLLAVIGDVAQPSWRASAIGIYRLWRDLGYAFGALVAGLVADYFGLVNASLLIAFLTAMSGVIVYLRLSESTQTSSN